MERHGYDDGWGSNYKEQETVGFSGGFLSSVFENVLK